MQRIAVRTAMAALAVPAASAAGALTLNLPTDDSLFATPKGA